MRFSTLFFDLDGTLTDPAEGICGCVRYALEKGGYPVGPKEEYFPWIGPPLERSFEERVGVDNREAKRLVSLYRERFSTVGLFENKVYDGIPSLLRALREEGARMAVTTGKPTVFSRRILEKFGILEPFETVCGISLDEAPLTKQGVILQAMAELGAENREGCLMIGDRLHDVEGAHLCGIPCLFVLYGYGSREEAETSGADYIVESVDELRSFLLGGGT